MLHDARPSKGVTQTVRNRCSGERYAKHKCCFRGWEPHLWRMYGGEWQTLLRARGRREKDGLAASARSPPPLPALVGEREEDNFNILNWIIEDRRRRLNPETVEALTCIKDWEAAETRLHHMVEDKELEEAFEQLYLD